MGLAYHNYENSYGAFPPSRVDSQAGRTAYGNSDRNGFVFLLPYVEQDSLAKMYVAPTTLGTKPRRSWDHSVNVPVSSTQVPVFLCPSVPNAGRTITWKSSDSATDSGTPNVAFEAAPADYGIMNQVAEKLRPVIGGDWPDGSQWGILQPNVPVRISQISDGTSNTFLIVEDAGRPQAWTRYGLEQPAYNGVTGAAWADVEAGFGMDGMVIDPATQARTSPCKTLDGCMVVNGSNRNEVYSFHRGGANILFGDGSVRFFKEGIAVGVVAATLTRARGEVVSNADF